MSAPTGSLQAEGDYAIKPDNSGQKLNTEDWPLLLKNYVSMNSLALASDQAC